jgi:UDP-N-acetylmuramyl pentapeptide synthase
MVAKFSLDDVCLSAGGVLIQGERPEGKGAIVYSLEKIRPGDWFIAFSDSIKDGHDELKEASERGACGAIVKRRSRYAYAPQGFPLVAVSDTRTAYFDLIGSFCKWVKPRVIGVTGTSGRRSAIFVMAHLLREKYSVHVSLVQGLNWMGCAESILEMPEKSEVLIFEAQAIERGEIAQIGGALEPEIAVITECRHPLPSASRDRAMAELYCEILETLSLEDKARAVIYDDSSAARERAKEILSPEHLILHSEQKSEVGGEPLTESLTESDIWSAVQVAQLLGLEKNTIKQVLTELCSEEQVSA